MIIGLDVGGTHTDVVLLGKQGLVKQTKVSTDSTNLFQTVLTGLDAATDGVDLQTIQRAVLSTTLATNLVVQRQLPPVGMVVSAGPGIDPLFFRTNSHYHIVQGAIDHRGREIEPLNEDEIRAIGETFQQEDIQCAGVVSKFSTRNPDHEKALALTLAPFVKNVFMGHQLSGGLNFPRRIATTYLNAAVYPMHKSFYEAVKQSLKQKGLDIPIQILKPDGGSMNFESSVDHPGKTILSGPSASVMGALPSAASSSASLVLDIGGTTTDMALLVNGVPLLDPSGIEIESYKTSIRALKTRSLGIGGDSMVTIQNGHLAIGPQRNGPAMAYGGPAPTPTDAFCVLGHLPDGDIQHAKDGLAPIAQALGVSTEKAAEQIVTAASRQILDGAKKMIDGINAKPVYTVHEMWAGSDIQPSRLLVLGGPAPQFAELFKLLFDGDVSVVPHWQVANAIGCALARTTCEVSLFADTSRNLVTAPSENFSHPISSDFGLEDATQIALELLRKKAQQRGGDAGQLQTEIVEASTFNMIRGFNTVGKDIRVRVQVKPGLIKMD